MSIALRRHAYQDTIERHLASLGISAVAEIDTRHIEAFMRSEHSTLDHLPSDRFRTEVVIALACIEEGGRENAERIARSFGL